MIQVRKVRTNQNTCDAGNRRCKNDHSPQQNIGFEVPFQVSKKIRPCNKADRGHEKDEPHIFHDFQRVRSKGRLSRHQVV